MKRSLATSCAAAAVLVAAAGCANPPTAPAAATAPAASPARELSATERLRVSDAEQVLIERCMKRAGFSYWTEPRLSLEKSQPLGYVNDDVEWAGEHGYGSRIAAEIDRFRQANPNGTYRASLSAERRRAFDTALDGGSQARTLSAEIPTSVGGGTIRKRLGGCSEEAEKRLYGDPEAWFQADKVVSNLEPLYVPRVTRDKRFKTALTSWARCMRQAGFAYPDPTAAREAAARAASFATETRTAVAEARCARTTSLATVARERQAHYLDALRDQYGDALDSHARLQQEAYARAAEITSPRA
ncbi:hypothetical protein [Streptomyces laurentii]|uniref:hypothetical protein n=1 Tax=Streptomyces laurentii TaxID=39478 RepID=UPI00367DA33F